MGQAADARRLPIILRGSMGAQMPTCCSPGLHARPMRTGLDPSEQICMLLLPACSC